MQILNFIKSLVSPVRMYKYRYMTVLITVCIFIISSYLLVIPRANYIKKHGIDLVKEQNYGFLQAIYNIPDNDETNMITSKLASLECVAGSDDISCSNLKDSEGNEIKYYTDNIRYVRASDNVNIDIKIVIDLNEKANRVYNVSEEFTYSENKFPDIQNTEYYLVLFNSEYMFYQANPTKIDDLNIEHQKVKLFASQATSYYSGIKINKDTFTNFGSTTGENLTKEITKAYVILENNTYSFFTLIICLIYPIVLSLLFWLFFKNKGRLKKYREYFNIAGISIIAPIILSFIAAWIAPMSDIMFNVYLLGFSLYYLFVLYKINNTSTIM